MEKAGEAQSLTRFFHPIHPSYVLVLSAPATYLRRLRSSGTRPTMPVANSAAEPGSGTVLTSGVNVCSSGVNVRLSLGGGSLVVMNGVSFWGGVLSFTAGGSSPLLGGVTVPVSGDVEVVSLWLGGGVAPPVGVGWLGGGVVSA